MSRAQPHRGRVGAAPLSPTARPPQPMPGTARQGEHNAPPPDRRKAPSRPRALPRGEEPGRAKWRFTARTASNAGCSVVRGTLRAGKSVLSRSQMRARITTFPLSSQAGRRWQPVGEVSEEMRTRTAGAHSACCIPRSALEARDRDARLDPDRRPIGASECCPS
jgi:hypothetical protein